MLRVGMYPYEIKGEESGIRRVVEAYKKYLPMFDVRIVPPSEKHDIIASHVGAYDRPDVLHCHGLYWTGTDKIEEYWQWETNQAVIDAARNALHITVPSNWVAETFKRDMRLSPHVLPHGIEWNDWQHTKQPLGYVLWNKNRIGDACKIEPLIQLASMSPEISFVSTFGSDRVTLSNLSIIGLQPHSKMKSYIQTASVYLSTTKETFGIGVLEAMASGVPVLGFDFGGNSELVKHGVNGYLARIDDYDDLREGLDYCLRYHDVLGANSRELAKQYTWMKTAERLAEIYRIAQTPVPATVDIVIPAYNYGDKVGRAIESALEQTYKCGVIVVDDGSQDGGLTRRVAEKYGVNYIWQENAGVANARNRGIEESNAKYIVCLDSDDAISPKFAETCVRALEKDRTLSIAYTGLFYIKPDGETGLSPWPAEYDYDRHVLGQNQIPTCCMFRRSMWERLGGYKQRYAPNGAGSEDAEFWLRAGAYGFKAAKVSDEGLFIYSWLSGRVSGNKNYREVNWRELHPWVIDGLHPFASLATPKSAPSHPVRSYDRPLISVIIPVGSTHKHMLGNAFDSLEGQTFREWEVVVAWDADEFDVWKEKYSRAYPYVKWVDCGGGKGAGYARNRGVEASKGKFLVFLDADDWMYPIALRTLYDSSMKEHAITYGDYVGRCVITPEFARLAQSEGRVLYYNEVTGGAILQWHASDYDCQRAQQQPQVDDMYIWNLITSIIPRVWHDEIGGFDETMESWEDWDYWIRLAKMGKCFYRVDETLVVYQFSTGTRREIGLQAFQKLIEYLKGKYAKLEQEGLLVTMPCSTCGGRRPPQPTYTAPRTVSSIEKAATMSDDNFILVKYVHPNRGTHKVLGGVTKTFYGYRGGGDPQPFYIDRRDYEVEKSHFEPVKVEKPAPPAEQKAPEPVKSDEEKPVELRVLEQDKSDRTTRRADDLQLVPGITSTIAIQLNAKGIYNINDLRSITVEQLLSLKGVGETRAKSIIQYLEDIKPSD